MSYFISLCLGLLVCKMGMIILAPCSWGCCEGFPGASDGKESAGNAGDPGTIPRSGRFPGEENGYPFQYSCLENSIHREAWQATVHGVAKS